MLRLRSQVLNKRKNETGRSVTLSGLLLYRKCAWKSAIFDKNTECPLFFHSKYLKQRKKCGMIKKDFYILEG